MPIVPIRGLTRLSDIQRAAAAAKAAIGRVPGAALDLPSDVLDKLRWLENSGRDFRAANAKMQKRVNDAFLAKLKLVMQGRAKVSDPWEAAASEYQDVVAERLATGGGDMKGKMKPLKPATIARKGNAKIGFDTGELLRRWVGAKVRVTRG